MRIMRWDETDPDAFQGLSGVERAAHQADDPLGPPMSARRLRVSLTVRGGSLIETWYATGPEDALGVPGWYHLRLPQRENLDAALLDLVVHPGHRRRGLGTELLRHAAVRASEHGRSRLGCETIFQGGAGAAFAEACGAQAGVAEARRVLNVAAIPPGRIAALREGAARCAAGYSLVSWTGLVPDEHLDGVAHVREAMNDAPSDFEDARWNAGRVRDQVNPRIKKSGNRCYAIAATHDATGQMAALTELAVDPESPQWGFQQYTAVARPHRGHRLGLLVKSAMLEWLATAEPGLRMIETGNADVNKYMISINEQLGFDLFGPGWQTYTIDVAAITAASG
jgi:GNAT superfamily N-acetyltransferase